MFVVRPRFLSTVLSIWASWNIYVILIEHYEGKNLLRFVCVVEFSYKESKVCQGSKHREALDPSSVKLSGRVWGPSNFHSMPYQDCLRSWTLPWFWAYFDAVTRFLICQWSNVLVYVYKLRLSRVSLLSLFKR